MTEQDVSDGPPTPPIEPEWILWSEADPARLARDREEMAQFAPGVEFIEPRSDLDSAHPHGGWRGELPRWPFDRPEPAGLDALLGSEGLVFTMVYAPAHPMLPPAIYPERPEPLWEEETQTVWHVAPGGALCLLQSDGAWKPEASITELLLKAAGWRIEYALMKAGVIDTMTVNGIVSDASLDGLIEQHAGASHSQVDEGPADVPQ